MKTLYFLRFNSLFFFYFVKYFLENVEKSLESGGFREGLSSYSKHNFIFRLNLMRQSACLVLNPITVNNFASLFNYMPVGRASDSMMAPT